MLARTSDCGSVAQWCLLLSLLPALVLAQASKTSQISSATVALNSLRPASARALCTSYIGSKPTTVVTVRETGISTVNVVATSTTILPTGEPRSSVTVVRTTTDTKTTTWVRGTMYPDTTDVYTTQTVTLVEPEWTQELPGTTTTRPSNTATVTSYYTLPDMRRRQAVSVPPALTTFPASIISSACSTYLGTSTQYFTHSFYSGTTSATVSTKWVTSSPPAVTSTRMVTTTRLALVTSTAQATATRVSVDTDTAMQYSGTVTTVNPDLLTTVLGPGTTTVTANVARATRADLINFEDLWNGYILLWGGYHGVLWQSGVNQRPSGEYAANGAYYLMANQGGWNPVIRSGRGDAALRLKSMSCNIGSNAAENSYATVVGTLAGRELYAIQLLCFKYSQAANDFRGRRLPYVDTISFRYSPGYAGGFDDIALDIIE